MGPSGTSRTCPLQGSHCTGDFQATSWEGVSEESGLQTGFWSRRRGEDGPRPGGGTRTTHSVTESTHLDRPSKPSARSDSAQCQAAVKQCVQVVGVGGREPTSAQRPSLPMPISRPPSTEPRRNLVVELGAEGSPALCTDHPVHRARKRAIFLTLKSHLFQSLRQVGSVTSDPVSGHLAPP